MKKKPIKNPLFRGLMRLIWPHTFAAVTQKHTIMKKMLKLTAILLVAFGGLLMTGCEKTEDEKPTLSSEKNVLIFRLPEISPAVTATVDQNAKTITALVPSGTDLSTLVPIIETSTKSTINPGSGVMTNFTGPVVYTVTAEDGTTSNYVATISLDGAGTETLTGTMSQNRTLANRNDGIDYIIDDMFYVDGNALLTVEAGVKIAFTGIYTGINVGANAGLKMIGTANNPVILTGPVNNNNKGSWAGLQYQSNRADNIMEYVKIINAGTQNSEAAIYLYGNSQLSMRNSEITGSATHGIITNDASLSVFSGNTISNCESNPILTNNLLTFKSFTTDNIFTGNTKPELKIEWADILEADLSLENHGIPYLFTHGLIVERNLTLKKGIVFAFEYGQQMGVRGSGKIDARGDVLNPVKFIGANNEAGFWSGISIESSRENILDHCIISNGGNDSHYMKSDIAIWEGAKLNLSNTKLMNSDAYGFQFSGSFTLTHSNVSFENCQLGNVYDYDNDVVHSNLP
ncbi:MAG: parallel beta-helix repeat-containing [Bacteroidetes bacterium]|nr:MAG: parallel beta-helix repeat-containing [Bacteroidota bacterium]